MTRILKEFENAKSLESQLRNEIEKLRGYRQYSKDLEQLDERFMSDINKLIDFLEKLTRSEGNPITVDGHIFPEGYTLPCGKWSLTPREFDQAIKLAKKLEKQFIELFDKRKQAIK